MLQISVFGEFRLANDGILVHTINTPRLQSLLAFLLIHRDTPQNRRSLAFMLWPDSSEAQARTNLRKLLYQLRQALPDADAHLDFEGQTVQWQAGSGFFLDFEAFHAAVRAAQQEPDEELRFLEQAADLYRGDLLPGCYDDWMEPEREQLRNQAAAVMERLVFLYEARRAYQSALVASQRLLQLDRLNENAYRHLMRLHALNDDRAGALRVYHSCVTTLAHELAVEPGKATRALYERLLQSDDPGPGISGSHAPAAGSPPVTARRALPLVGRQQEWQGLLQSWESAVEGQPQCLIIAGEAGIGKTRLAEELLRWIQHQGFLTAPARCFAAEGNIAYAPVAEWLRSDALRPHWKKIDPLWQSEIARVVPELLLENPGLPQPGPLLEDWQRRKLYEALLQAVRQARPASIALLIDDIQWCDQQTLHWLHFLMRSAPPLRLLLIGTLRIEELSTHHPLESWLADLRYSGRLTELDLGPLSATETAELAAYESGQVLDPASAAHLFAETEGHPLFVIESVRMSGGTAAGSTGGASERKLPSPTVQAVIDRRLAQLSPAGRDLAGIAAVIGRSFIYPVLARVSSEVDEMALVRCLDELWQRRIIREQGTDAYDFSHDRIREAAYQGLSAARRRLLHRQVGEVLASFGQDRPELILQAAAHFDRAGLPAQAVHFYHQAAGQARQIFANEEAVRCYHRALELLEPERGQQPALAAEIAEQLGDLLLVMTHREEARAAFERALTALPQDEQIARARLLCKIGNTWRDEYQFEESLPIYNQALKLLGDPPQEDQQAVVDWWNGWIQAQIEIGNVYYWLGWIEKLDEIFRETSPAIERFGTLKQRVTFYGLQSGADNRRNRYLPSLAGITSARRAVDALRAAGSLDSHPALQFGYGLVLFLHNDLDAAEPELRAAMGVAEQRGDLSLLSRCLTYLALLYRKRGHIGQVTALANRAQKTAEEAQMPEYVGAACANLGWAAWRTSDFARARNLCQAALTLWQQSPGVQAAATPYYDAAIWPLLAMSLDEDNLAQAVELIRDLLQPQRKRLPDRLTAALEEVLAAAETSPVARQRLASTIALAEVLHAV